MHIARHSDYPVYLGLSCDWARKVLLHELQVHCYDRETCWFACTLDKVTEQHGHSIKNIKIFYITISPVLKYFCSGILVSYPETAKQPYWMLGKNPTFWQTKELYYTEILNLLLVAHEYKTMLKFLFQLNFWEQWRIKLGHAVVKGGPTFSGMVQA